MTPLDILESSDAGPTHYGESIASEPAPLTEQRSGSGRRAADRRRALEDWGNDLAACVDACLDARTEIGYEAAFNALVVDALKIAKDLGITDTEGRHQ